MTQLERKPGRPRSTQSRESILQAALDLVSETGYRATTIDAIAARAGTGKQTIYRWWRNKAEVVLEALNESAEREIPTPDTGDLRGDLHAFLQATFAAGRRPGTVPVLRALMAEAQFDAAFREVFDQQFLRRRREVLANVLRRHPDQLRGVTVPVAVEVVFGVLWYRVMATHRRLDGALARELTRLLAG